MNAKSPLPNWQTAIAMPKLLLWEPIREIYRGVKEGALPLNMALPAGILLSQFHYWGGFNWLLDHFISPIRLPNLISGVLGGWLVVSMIHAWGIRQIAIRRRLQEKLNKTMLEASLKTKLEEFPTFVFDLPVGSISRKLRMRSMGIPISRFKGAKEVLESGLNVNVSKIENPRANRELVDVIYSLEKMPDFWELLHASQYQNHSFPVGKTVDREITSSLLKVPHYLVAGETASGKSTFIRSMVMVLVQNNPSMKVLFIDLKGKMDGQVFDGFDQVTVLSDTVEVENGLVELSSLMDRRMEEAQKAKAQNILEFNSRQSESGRRWGRYLIVVDEIAELMPSLKSPDKARLVKIQAAINRFSRVGRATGFHLVIGVQKPDHKNLDPTVKANLPGIVCFPVSHFSQSVLVLGNGHAAELNAEKVGRGIWKHGSYEVEIQAPFLSAEEIEKARNRFAKSFDSTLLNLEDRKAHEEKEKVEAAGPYSARE